MGNITNNFKQLREIIKQYQKVIAQDYRKLEQETHRGQRKNGKL